MISLIIPLTTLKILNNARIKARIYSRSGTEDKTQSLLLLLCFLKNQLE